MVADPWASALATPGTMLMSATGCCEALRRNREREGHFQMRLEYRPSRRGTLVLW